MADTKSKQCKVYLKIIKHSNPIFTVMMSILCNTTTAYMPSCTFFACAATNAANWGEENYPNMLTFLMFSMRFELGWTDLLVPH